MTDKKHFYKTISLVGSWFGLKPRKKLKFTVEPTGFQYDSRLGKIGTIQYSDIESIDVFQDDKGFQVLRITIAQSHKAVFKSRLSQWGSAMSKEFERHYNSEIAIFPNEIDDDIKLLYETIQLSYKK